MDEAYNEFDDIDDEQLEKLVKVPRGEYIQLCEQRGIIKTVHVHHMLLEIQRVRAERDEALAKLEKVRVLCAEELSTAEDPYTSESHALARAVIDALTTPTPAPEED